MISSLVALLLDSTYLFPFVQSAGCLDSSLGSGAKSGAKSGRTATAPPGRERNPLIGFGGQNVIKRSRDQALEVRPCSVRPVWAACPQSGGSAIPLFKQKKRKEKKKLFIMIRAELAGISWNNPAAGSVPRSFLQLVAQWKWGARTEPRRLSVGSRGRTSARLSTAVSRWLPDTMRTAESVIRCSVPTRDQKPRM